MKKIFLMLTAVFFAAGVVFADSDKTLATVNNEPIFASAFESIFGPVFEQYKRSVPASEQTSAKEKELRDAVLSQKIDEVILVQETKKQKVKVSKKEVQDAINNQKQSMNLNEAAFNSELKKAGLTKAAYEKRIEETLAIQKLAKKSVEPKVKQPSESDVKAFYDKVMLKFNGKKTGLSQQEDAVVADIANQIKRSFGEQAKISQIFVNAPKNAADVDVRAAKAKIEVIKKELKDKSFGTVAAQYSDDAGSKARNGDMGFVANGDLIPALNKIVFSLKLGEWTKDPVKTDAGFHFIKVEEQRAKRSVTFDAVKNDLANIVYQQNARKAYEDYVQELRKRSNVKINKNW